MLTESIREKSRKKTQLIRDSVVSAAFFHYFEKNWEAKKILNELRSAGAQVEHLREWALYSTHGLGGDEAEEKQKRSRMLKVALRKAIVGYRGAREVYSIYALMPHDKSPEMMAVSAEFKRLVEMNEYLCGKAELFLKRAESGAVYRTKRLGVTWNCAYLYFLKAYMARLTDWTDRQILEAITHLIAAAHLSMRWRIPENLRVLLGKAMRRFENDPRNTTIVERLKKAASDSRTPYQLFPIARANSIE